MPDTYEIQTPDGSTLEIQSDGPPTAATALRAMRAYGDVQAAGAQKKAEAGSTFRSQMTPSNLLHDAGTVAGAGWDVLKTLAKEGWKNPLGINPPDIRYDPAAHANDPSLRDQATSTLGTLRTVPGRVRAAVTDPIGALQAAGVTPDIAAHAGGTVAAVGAVGAALPNAGQLTTSGGNLVTRAGEAMNPAVTKTLGEGVGALAEAGLGGATGNPMGGLGRVFAGSKIGGAIGEVVPAMTRKTGRLITKAGQFMGSANGTPAGPTPPPVDVKAAAEQMGLSPSPTGATMESMPNTPAPPAARMPIPVEPAAQAAVQAETAAAAEAARGAQSAELGVSPQATGATMESLPNTPVPQAARAPIPVEPVAQAATQADAAARRAELMQQLGVGEKPPLLAEAPEPTAVSGEAREPIPVPVKSEPQPIPPAARSNTVLPAKDLGQILREVQQQLAEEPVTTASGSPPQTVTAGGKPAVTQAEYDALQARIPENAARATDPLPAIDQPKPEPTAAPPAADEAEAVGVPEAVEAGPARAEPQPKLPWDEPALSGESVTPARSEKSAAELARDAIGARDQAAALRRQGIPATTESVRAETRARTTGGTGETSVISLNATNRIAGKMKDMLDSGASDKELLDYVNKARPADRKQIGLMLNGLLVGMGRAGIPILGAAGAAAVGGGALRNALVNQLQGDQKEQD